jgi:hypothetical protein
VPESPAAIGWPALAIVRLVCDAVVPKLPAVVETIPMSSSTAFSQTSAGTATERNFAATSAELTVDEMTTKTLPVASLETVDGAALTVTV